MLSHKNVIFNFEFFLKLRCDRQIWTTDSFLIDKNTLPIGND